MTHISTPPVPNSNICSTLSLSSRSPRITRTHTDHTISLYRFHIWIPYEKPFPTNPNMPYLLLMVSQQLLSLYWKVLTAEMVCSLTSFIGLPWINTCLTFSMRLTTKNHYLCIVYSKDHPFGKIICLEWMISSLPDWSFSHAQGVWAFKKIYTSGILHPPGHVFCAIMELKIFPTFY